MEKMDLDELDLITLEQVTAGLETPEKGEDGSDPESPLTNDLVVDAAVEILRAFVKAFMPKTFEQFYNDVYLKNQMAFDIAVCAAGGFDCMAAYMLCDRKKFWQRIYDKLA